MQILRWHVTRLADPGQASLIQHRESTLGECGGNPRPEQGGSQEPPLHLGISRINVDAEFRREPPAQDANDAAGKSRRAG